MAKANSTPRLAREVPDLTPPEIGSALANPLICDEETSTVKNVRDVLSFLMGAMDNIEEGPFLGEGMVAASPAQGAALVIQACLYALGTVKGGAA
ncbi:MAG: hypothetical protein WC073_05250 [Sterolibacterium sp.]